MKFRLLLNLRISDPRQQPPQIAPTLDDILPIAGTDEKAPIGRLHDIFRIDPLSQLLRKGLASHGQQALEIAVEKRKGSLLVSTSYLRCEIDRIACHVSSQSCCNPL